MSCLASPDHMRFEPRSPLADSFAETGQPVPIVYVVDDDASMRTALCSLLRSVSIDCKTFDCPQAFLREPEPAGPACLVLDVRLPDTSGFDVQQALRQRGRAIPVIFITGHGTIPMTVRAMKAGALEFLTKPFVDEELLGAIRRALDTDREAAAQRGLLRQVMACYQTLTPRERQVMALVVEGLLNKQAAARLGTSEITIKVHRRQVMSKMKADSLPDLVRMAERLRGGLSS